MLIASQQGVSIVLYIAASSFTPLSHGHLQAPQVCIGPLMPFPACPSGHLPLLCHSLRLSHTCLHPLSLDMSLFQALVVRGEPSSAALGHDTGPCSADQQEQLGLAVPRNHTHDLAEHQSKT